MKGFASQFLDYVDERAGLLIGRGGTPERPRVYSFPHRQFQEYLAGCYIVGAPRAAARLQELAQEGDFWSEAVLLGIEEQVYNSGSYGTYTVLNLASNLTTTLVAPQNEGEERLILWMGKVPEVIGAPEVAGDPGDVEPGEKLLGRLQGQLVGLLGGTLPPIERVEAGRTLAKIGDPRKELITLEDMAFCYVPAGPFEMGSTERDREKPESTIDVPYGYWMGESPVTQAQYHEFVKAGGYEERKWWTDAGWEYMHQQERKAPELYSYPFGLSNNPVVGVTWYEAHAFSKWFTAHAQEQQWINPGFTLVLPNEPEWEKGARGGLEVPEHPIKSNLLRLENRLGIGMATNPRAKKRYPWGEDITENHCNYNSNMNSTSASGCFPKGKSVYGIQDLAGNVWEWTRSMYKEYPYNSVDGREDTKGKDRRVLRGGSFGSLSLRNVRCANRLRGQSGLSHYYYVGFRLVALPPPE